ncbi:olfactory receptor 52K1-like [Diretmus argenteus]
MDPLMENVSHTYFILNGFNELGELRPLLFIPFSFMFLLSISANSLLFYVIVSQRVLHSPMYILIALLACVDLIIVVYWVPNMLVNFLFDLRGISLTGCLIQLYCIQFTAFLQSSLLVWMALDRYFAICTPLYYHNSMAVPRFLKFVIPLLIRNFLLNTVMVSLAGRLLFCYRNAIDHCFCEHMALVTLACGNTSLNNRVGLVTIFLIPVTDFIIVTISYVIIFRSVFRSGTSGLKALNTCVTHIIIITVCLITALTAFLSYRIRNSLSPPSRIFISTMYLLFPSCFNPIIYGLRTKEIRQQILRVLNRIHDK